MAQELSLTPREFCKLLLIALYRDGVDAIPNRTRAIETAFARVLDLIEQECRKAIRERRSEDAQMLLQLLDKLGPEASTGQHDLLWTTFASLQPGCIYFPNPTYKRAGVKSFDQQAMAAYEGIPGKLRALVEDSAKIVSKAIAA